MIAILAGSLVAFVLGFLWYGPFFGKYWIKLEGFTEEQLKENQTKGMFLPMTLGFINTVIGVLVVSYVMTLSLPLSYAEFWKIVLIVWLGFGFTIQAGAYLWGGKPWKLVFFNAAYSIVSLTLVSAIVYFW